MSTFHTITEVLKLSREAGVTCYVWGHRGLGKSSMVKQLALAGVGEKVTINDGKKTKEINAPMGFIDLRCSQIEASDLRGLPDKIEGRTTFLPPADMPIGDMTAQEILDQLNKIDDPDARMYEEVRLQPRFKHGILFLDELSRANDDVLQAAFQLVLDRKCGQYVLPTGWQVVVAGNFLEGYQTNGFSDPAFLDRFCHVTLTGGEATLDEWVQYMGKTFDGEAAQVIEYCASHLTALDGNVSGELGFSIQPSRRSWEMAVRIMNAAKVVSVDPRSITEALAGLLGRETAVSFQKHSCPVKPLDLLRDGVAKHKKALSGLTRNQLIGVSWGLVSFTKDRVKKEKDVAGVCLDVAEFLLTCPTIKDRDIPVAFCRNLVQGSGGAADHERATLASLTNKKLADLMSKFNTNENAFLTELNKRPALQDILSAVGWGTDDK